MASDERLGFLLQSLEKYAATGIVNAEALLAQLLRESFEQQWWDPVPDQPELRFFKDIALQGVWVAQFFPSELPREEGEMRDLLRERLNALGETLMLAWREWKEQRGG